MDLVGHLGQTGPQALEVLGRSMVRGVQLFFDQRRIQSQSRKPLRQIVVDFPGKPPELFFLGVDNPSGEFWRSCSLRRKVSSVSLRSADVYGHAHHIF